MTSERIIAIALGAVAMFTVMLLRRKQYPHVAFWKLPIICVMLTICGVLGTILLFFIENGSFAGTSFFGAVLLVPILMLPLLLLRIPYGTLMDICATAECAMLAVMKLDCLAGGCCYGKLLYNQDGIVIRFPSQIVEMITIIIIMFVLFRLDKKETNKNKLYPYYLILYGATRAVLNYFRGGISPLVWIIPNGTFWGLFSILLGLAWLQRVKRKETVN